MKLLFSLLMAAFLLGACQSDEATDPVTHAAPEPAKTDPEPTYEVVSNNQEAIFRSLNHSQRPETDVERDQLRHPAEVLAFAGIESGMCVLDLFTAGGYYAEILSRLVGQQGEVWAQNPPQFYERFGSADLDFRLADRRLPNVERQDRPLEDLALPSERFDAVVAAMVFHDFFWLTKDVSRLLEQVYTSMRPGGIMLITDHAAPDGSGTQFALDPEGKHRVDEQVVVELMEQAGFELVDTSDVLRVPEDDRGQAFFEPEMRGKPTDRFVHLYRKPG